MGHYLTTIAHDGQFTSVACRCGWVRMRCASSRIAIELWKQHLIRRGVNPDTIGEMPHE